MNILLTHLHLDFPGGPETYKNTVARPLLEKGHGLAVVPGDGGTPAGRNPVARRVPRARLLKQEDASPSPTR